MESAEKHPWISRLMSGLGLPDTIGQRRSATESVRILAMMKGGADFDVVADVAERMNWAVTLTSQYDAARAAPLEGFAVVLCDRDLTANWRACLDEFVRAAPHSAVILMSNVNDSFLWDEVTSKGGYDVLRKPLSRETVSAVVSRAVAYWRLR
jgi:DNA-binding NtrC family response regulator